MSSASTSRANILLEDSIPVAGASLESILCTEELQRRPSRPTDYEKENCALVALMSVLADSPSTIFQKVAETILDITQCDSAGLSLLTSDGKRPDVCGKRFYWPAIAGMWNPHVGGGTPRNFGPCGDVLDQTVGTIWAIMHSDRRKFDAEDDRVMASLGKFSSSAYQALVHIEDLKFQVAEREKAEAAVRKLANGLEARIRSLVDANIMGIVIWNSEGEIIDANEAFLHMVQYGREDLVSGRLRWTDLTPAEWRDRDERAIAEAKATGAIQPFEKEYFRKNGSRVPVLIGAALFEAGGNEGVAFVMDITERKRAEEEHERLRQAQADLARLNRVSTMGELTASLAHEIKQPMFAAAADAETCLQWLVRDQPDVAEAQEAALRLMKDLTRASDIINRIVTLFKKDVPQRELVDVNGVIQEVIALLRSESNRYSVSIHSQLTEGLPDIMADRVALQQVLMNLMVNAIEAIKEMDGPGRLTITTRQDENRQLLVSVTDSGVGLPPGQAEQIFNAFFTSKPQGIGMGLPISRSIIESHGGRLWGTSNSGPGATFQFTLPVEAAARQSA